MKRPWDLKSGTSPAAFIGRRKRVKLRAMTDGKCFYCGVPTRHQGSVGDRDWLLLDTGFEMVSEHKTPIIRGGTDAKQNRIPACARCNRKKAAFTFDEFRLLSGLQTGTLNFRFALEAPAVKQRDWLCCHTPTYEQFRSLLIHNIPDAAMAYAALLSRRVRRLRERSAK